MSYAICEKCGQPLGTGTLLDMKPAPDVPEVFRVAPEIWQDFARKYRCPACAKAMRIRTEEQTRTVEDAAKVERRRGEESHGTRRVGGQRYDVDDLPRKADL